MLRGTVRSSVIAIAVGAGALSVTVGCNNGRGQLPGEHRDASTDTSPASPIRVLVVTATQGFRHTDAIDVSKVVLKQAEQSTELRFDFTEDPTALTAQNLRKYDVLFLNNSTLRIVPANPNDSASRAAAHAGPRSTPVAQPITPEQQRAIAAFVRSGKGLVAVHSGVDALYGWPEYREIVGGGLFQSHPFNRLARVTVEDPKNPAVAHFGPTVTFKEEYYYLDTNPRPNAHVLASLDLASVGDTSGTDHPLVFIKRHGEGRVYVNVLGHYGDTWRRPDYVFSVLQGLRLAAGRLPADFSPTPR
jgi:type 1 glutamine amidotransferase